MGAVGLVDVPAEGGPPAGVVHADISVKGHPVGDRGFISLSCQGGVPLFVGNAVHPGRRIVAPGRIAGHEIRFQDQLAVLVVKKVLGSQVNFHISGSVIRFFVRSRRLVVDRGALPALPVFNHLRQLRSLLCVVHPPAVIARIDRDFFSVAGLKRPGAEDGIVLLAEGGDIFRHLLLVKPGLEAIESYPAGDGGAIQDLRIFPKGVCNRHTCVFLRRGKSVQKAFVVGGDLRASVAARLVQVQLFCQAVHRRADGLKRPLIIQLISLGFRHDLKAVFRRVFRNVGVHRRDGEVLLKALKLKELSLQRSLVAGHQFLRLMGVPCGEKPEPFVLLF